MADDNALEPVPNDNDDHDDTIAADAALVYEAQTERLRVYAVVLRVTLPKPSATAGFDAAADADIDPDVHTARNLALEAVFADIRRIAGLGISSPGTAPGRP